MPPLDPPILRDDAQARGPTRREVLAAFPAGAALLVAGCKPPDADIVPYIAMPEGLIPGRPLFFATTLALNGEGRGAVVESHQGRPTKIHGNPGHPASLGATDPFMEAAVLDLFDPSRPRVPRKGMAPASWVAVEGELTAALGPRGAGARLLTGPLVSPTMARQIAGLLRARSDLVWHAIEPAPGHFDLDLGQGPLRAAPDLGRARVILSLGCDFLGPGPGQVAAARGYAEARRGGMRLHVVEPMPTLTGAKADRRTGATWAEIGALALWLEEEGDPSALPSHLREAAVAARADLMAGSGAGALVLGGPEFPPEAARAIARLDARLGAPLAYHARPEAMGDLGLDLPAPRSAPELVTAMQAGEVSALVILDADPVHALPAVLGFREALGRVGWTACASVAPSDTAALCLWSLPLAHALEEWSDLRGPDGTVGLVQPLIAPIFESRSRHEILAAMAGTGMLGAQGGGARAAVQATWAAWREGRGEDAGGFDAFWLRALQDGVIEGTALPPLTPDPTARGAEPAEAPAQGLELSLRPSPAAWLGERAGNAWLQECPESFTKQVWGNALWMAPEDAAALSLVDGDAARVTSAHGHVLVPVLVVPGQHPGTLALTLGQGRQEAGPVGTGVGVNAAALLPPEGTPWLGGITVERTGGTMPVARTQTHFDDMGREPVRTVTPARPATSDDFEQPSLLPPPGTVGETGPHAWAMVIDLDLCIGCNACVVACQSENNIPVVGPDEVQRGRSMHWMRVDAYHGEDGHTAFQPVPCMHCERAPCELVCPVEASVHDAQGLNVQVYNRCVGTRFCQANCPYKVRRFNFYDYTGDQAYANQGSDLLAALRNPDVTVRARGVMEKCTYCVQRIEEAKIEAGRQGVPVPEGAVRTACQDACPSEAIVFGDLAHPDAAVSLAKREPRHYALLGDLGTRPRTTYLARIDALGDGGNGEDGA